MKNNTSSPLSYVESFEQADTTGTGQAQPAPQAPQASSDRVQSPYDQQPQHVQAEVLPPSRQTYTQAPGAPVQKTKRTGIVIGIIVGVVLACCLCCIGSFYLAGRFLGWVF